MVNPPQEKKNMLPYKLGDIVLDEPIEHAQSKVNLLLGTVPVLIGEGEDSEHADSPGA